MMTKFKFDEKIEKMNGRGVAVEEYLTGGEEFGNVIRHMVRHGERIDDTGLGCHLDNLTNYFLESKNNEMTGREIDETYYKSERDFRRYKAGKSTILTDDDSLLEALEFGSRNDEIDSEIDSELVLRLIHQLGERELRRLISSIGTCQFNLDDMRVEVKLMVNLTLINLKMLATDREYIVLNGLIHGHSVGEISEVLNVGVRAIQKRYENLIKKYVKMFGK